jgi:hypothetical protein
MIRRNQRHHGELSVSQFTICKSKLPKKTIFWNLEDKRRYGIKLQTLWWSEPAEGGTIHSVDDGRASFFHCNGIDGDLLFLVLQIPVLGPGEIRVPLAG